MTAHPAPLPGLATMAELLEVGPRVVRCRDCHRPLIGREARLRGRGDACRHQYGGRDVRGPGRFEVEQEGLFGA